MHHVIYPPDPDCQVCNGTGAIISIKASSRPGMQYTSYTKCVCAKYENITKIQSRCKHEYTCKKCNKTCHRTQLELKSSIDNDGFAIFWVAGFDKKLVLKVPERLHQRKVGSIFHAKYDQDYSLKTSLTINAF